MCLHPWYLCTLQVVTFISGICVPYRCALTLLVFVYLTGMHLDLVFVYLTGVCWHLWHLCTLQVCPCNVDMLFLPVCNLYNCDVSLPCRHAKVTFCCFCFVLTALVFVSLAGGHRYGGRDFSVSPSDVCVGQDDDCGCQQRHGLPQPAVQHFLWFCHCRHCLLCTWLSVNVCCGYLAGRWVTQVTTSLLLKEFCRILLPWY